MLFQTARAIMLKCEPCATPNMGWLMCGARDFLMIETMLHAGIRECSGVKLVTSIRDPLSRILSHLAFEHIALDQALAILKQDKKPNPNNFMVQVGKGFHAR